MYLVSFMLVPQAITSGQNECSRLCPLSGTVIRSCLCPARQYLCRQQAEPSPAHLRLCVLPGPGELAQPERKCPHGVNQCAAKDNGIRAPAAVACPSPRHLSTRVVRAGPGQLLHSASTLLISPSRCLGAPHTAK